MVRPYFNLEEHIRSVPEWWAALDHDLNPTANWVLSAAYAAIAVVAGIQLGRIQMRVPEYGWTTQKVFHLLNLVVALCRTTVFALRPSLERLAHAGATTEHVKVFLKASIFDIPGLLFFTTYTLLVLFWAEIYHQARSLPTTALKPVFVSINVFVYVLQVGLLLLFSFANDVTLRDLARELSGCSLALISGMAAAGFLIYGGRLFLMLRRFPIESRGRKKKLREVGLITTICTFCFSVRSAVILLSVFDRKDAELDVMRHPLLNLVYYSIAEIIPAALVLYTLRKLPPKRTQQGYQPISNNR